MKESQEYRLSASEMVNLAAGEYLRTFWWYVAIVPLFGLLAAIFGEGPLRMIGATAVLWPLSIPARAVLSTGKARRLFGAGVRARIEDDGLYIVPSQPNVKGLRLRWNGIRAVKERGQWALVQTRRFGFLPIPLEFGKTLSESHPGAPSSTRPD